MNKFRVTADGLNLRKGPSTDTAVISELFANTVVEKLESA